MLWTADPNHFAALPAHVITRVTITGMCKNIKWTYSDLTKTDFSSIPGSLKGNFVAYYRVSTHKQGINGLGMDAQRNAVMNYLNGGMWLQAKAW